MSKRRRLIWKTLILCSAPVAVAAAILLVRRSGRDAPYVAGTEQEGITRSLDRAVDPGASPIRFTEVTESAGVRFELFPFRRTSQLPEDMAGGVAWGDYDGDGFPDLFLVNFAAPVGASDADVARSTATDRLFRNRGDGTFEDVTAAAGVGRAHRGMGAAWGDFDSDGDLDLVVSSWGANILWENRGDGTFRDVTKRAGLTGEGFWTGVAWSDFDLDGDLDLYVCGYVRYTPEPEGSPLTRAGPGELPFTLNPSSYPPRQNRLYVSRGDGTFEERAAAAGVLGEKGRSLSAAWTDLDADGFPDLYVANDVSDNNLFRNRGDGTFEDVSYAALVADYRGAMGIGVADWDGDLDLDLFVAHWIAQENALYTNQLAEMDDGRGKGKLFFGDDADRVGLGQISLDLIGWGTSFADLDSDGWEDLFVANGSTFQERDDPTKLIPMPPHLYWNRGPDKGFFEVGGAAGLRTDPPGVGRGAAFADYDQDGDLDLVIVRHGGRARLLRNDTPQGHRIGFRLQGTRGHPSGLGARIVVHATGGRSLLREAGAGAPYLSQNDTEVLVGLGAAAGIDSVEVTWPGGARDVWKGLEEDRLWLLREGGEPRALGRTWDATVAENERGSASGGSRWAVVADVSSALSRADRARLWDLKAGAQRAYHAGRWNEAADAFREMLALDPSNLDALYSLGNALLESAKYAGALDAWQRLATVNPQSARAWLQIGILHTMPAAGAAYDLNEAVAAFRRAHELNREESRSLVLWGEAALAAGDVATAADVVSTAHRMNPQDPAASYLSAYVAWTRGRRERARELLEAAKGAFAETPSAAASAEGDIRSDRMLEARRRAAHRRLFSGCVEALRSAVPPLEPERLLACVDRTIAALPRRP